MQVPYITMYLIITVHLFSTGKLANQMTPTALILLMNFTERQIDMIDAIVRFYPCFVGNAGIFRLSIKVDRPRGIIHVQLLGRSQHDIQK